MENTTYQQIKDAINLLQDALEAKHPWSEDATITIKATNSPDSSYVTDDESGIVASRAAGIASYLE